MAIELNSLSVFQVPTVTNHYLLGKIQVNVEVKKIFTYIHRRQKRTFQIITENTLNNTFEVIDNGFRKEMTANQVLYRWERSLPE